ncbi:hypothetical protein TNCT_637211 [Trichonephila clavata]|uniref:Uncharacterized protein n=1 Tax=Trichonephila clavata TaxID=2740835 RepID=A0A8X6LRV0_TRICU|nr:hypothetical protein TNCT_637211 [Trichonephila clavata]
MPSPKILIQWYSERKPGAMAFSAIEYQGKSSLLQIRGILAEGTTLGKLWSLRIKALFPAQVLQVYGFTHLRLRERLNFWHQIEAIWIASPQHNLSNPCDSML